MKRRLPITILVLIIAVGGFLLIKWKQDEPRRNCIRTLQRFCLALDSRDSDALFKAVVLPQVIANRSPPEQIEFLTKVLQDEVSFAGVEALKARAAFGPLLNIFPNEGTRWAGQAGSRPEDCVALKMERAGILAEVVLLREGSGYRVVRCNNVKQMAGGA